MRKMVGTLERAECRPPRLQCEHVDSLQPCLPTAAPPAVDDDDRSPLPLCEVLCVAVDWTTWCAVTDAAACHAHTVIVADRPRYDMMMMI